MIAEVQQFRIAVD